MSSELIEIRDFLEKNENKFVFEESLEYKKDLCEKCYKVITSKGYDKDKISAVCALRVLSREKSEIIKNNISTDKMIEALLELTDYHHYANQDKKCLTVLQVNSTLVEETVKALFNIVKNFEANFSMKLSEVILKGGLNKVSIYSENVEEINQSIQMLECRLLLYLTAVKDDLRKFAIENCDAFDSVKSLFYSHSKYLDKEVSIDNIKVDIEIIKFLFNLTYSLDKLEVTKKLDESIRSMLREFKDLFMKILSKLNGDIYEDLRDSFFCNSVNILVTIPDQLLDCFLLIGDNDIDNGDVSTKSKLYLSSKVMRFFEICVTLLDMKITLIKSKPDDGSLATVLQVLGKVASCNRNIRKYLRLHILPYLKEEVYKLPQEGTSIRNKLCQLLQSSNDTLTESAAFFIFVLCKNSVDRCVKYTGFGNFAGFLVRHSLMNQCSVLNKSGDVAGGGDIGSSSDDSETEEYEALKEHVNPVTGRVEKSETKKDMFEGMTEEQKEYEVVQLMNQIDRLQREGFISPAVFSEDGSVRPAESVLEVVEKANKNKEGK